MQKRSKSGQTVKRWFSAAKTKKKLLIYGRYALPRKDCCDAVLGREGRGCKEVSKR